MEVKVHERKKMVSCRKDGREARLRARIRSYPGS